MDGTVSDWPFTSRDPTLKFKVNDDFQKVEKRYDFPARMSEKSPFFGTLWSNGIVYLLYSR